MQPDPDYLRRHYGSLSDEALLAIDRADLVETAQQLYDAEVSRRKLRSRKAATPRATPEASEDMSVEDAEGDDDFPATEDWLPGAAEVYSAYLLHGQAASDAATTAMSVLKAAGIPCHVETVEVREEETPPAAQRMRLLVPENLSLRAMSTLERDISNQEFEDVWKSHLEQLSDDELLAATPEDVLCGLFDRVERVTRTYDEEIARRGLDAE